PRMRPDHFYDIVVEVAIIRPGPIVGQMVNPYLERRAGRKPPTVPHPSLWPVLERTLGVPLFQEQLMRIAMVAANFTGGEADELRRAMGSKRSVDRMKHIEERLRAGMAANGIPTDAQGRGVRVRPIDVARSDWLCTLERAGPEEELRLRLGLRYARGLREEAAKKLVAERAVGPFASIADFSARVPLRREELATLAE